MNIFLRSNAALATICLGLMSAVALAGPVNINTADAETLAAELDGVGITKARAIVAYRNANGLFKTPETLTNVTGIGERTVALNLSNIRIKDVPPTTEASAK